MTNWNPLVSVIVPTKNSSRTLDECLGSLSAQTYSQIEVIVVDNSSSDDTKTIAKKYTDKVYNIGPERSAQRNYGVEVSHGEYVAIIDSDMTLSENVIKECVDKIRDDRDIKGLIIPEESFGQGFWAQCKKLERSYYIGLDWMEAARFFSKDVYVELGGYDTGLVSGEDWDLSNRVREKYRVERINGLILHDEGRLSLLKTMQKKFYYASQILKYTSKHDNMTVASQTSVVSRFALFFKDPKKLFENPVVGIGMLFMKLCEFAAGGAGIVFSKI